MPLMIKVLEYQNSPAAKSAFGLGFLVCLLFSMFSAQEVLSKPERKPVPLSKSDFELKKQSSSSTLSHPSTVRIEQKQQTAHPSIPAAKQPSRPNFVQPPLVPTATHTSKPASFETSFTSWPAKTKEPIAAIVSIHGFGLHKESFAGFAKEMANRGVSTYAIDVRGFGSWMGEKSEDKKLDFYQTMMDLRSSIYWVKTMNPGVPIFLLGESMGGAIALQATALFPECVSGLIASVPGAEFYGGKKTAMEVALRMVRPNSKFNVGGKVIEKATSDEKLRENWLNDPRARKEMTPKQMAQFAAFMNQSDEMARRIDSVPVLMLQGGKDKLSKADGTERLYKALKTPYKDYVLLDEAEHLIFEKGQYTAHTADIVENWLTKQTQRLKSAGFSNPR
jgi:acylglycerol lipase